LEDETHTVTRRWSEGVGVLVWQDAVMSPDDREEPPGLVWWRVPEDELGVALPDRVVVASSQQFAIIVGEITAYTRGFR
jgi:hypothetical protein